MWFFLLKSVTLRFMESAVTNIGLPSNLRRRYARYVNQRRLQAGLTQQALGQAVGLHRVYIGRFESGSVNFSLDTLHKVLQFLSPGVNPPNLTERLAANLKKFRGDFSQEAFAGQLELPVLLISRLERQAVTTTIDQVDRIATQLGVEGELLLE